MNNSNKIVLLGYMGCGKSVIGRELASKIGYTFLDLDLEIERQEGMTISEIFSKKGEIYFRKKEIVILKKQIQSNEKQVISLGGGTPCYGDTMKFLTTSKNVITFYLKTDVDTLTDRLHHKNKKRPLIAHLETKEELNDFIRKHLFERTPFYNQAAFVVDATSNKVSEKLHSILLQLF